MKENVSGCFFSEHSVQHLVLVLTLLTRSRSMYLLSWNWSVN